MSDPAGPPCVALPAPLARKLRLGPFPTARHALRFVTYAAAGVLVAAWLTPLGWVPFVVGGFILSAFQTHGKSLDEFAAGFVRFRWRATRPTTGDPSPAPVAAGGSRARCAGGRSAAVVSTGGLPVAFLPPEDARTLFDGYREILRGLEDGMILRVSSEPLSATPFRVPELRDTPGRDQSAREGYTEMVRLLCRRRRRRTVDVVLWTPDSSAGSRARLESRIEALVAQLTALGLQPGRRAGRALDRSMRLFGWAPEAIE